MTTVVVAVLVVHNLVTNLWLADRWYVPVNLATAAWLVVLARPADIGLSAGPAAVSAGVAGALLVLVVMGLMLADAVPGSRRLLADQRMAGGDGRGTAWRALVRIPLGTVALEEVAFRGVLPALTSPVLAAALFGLWHVVPTLKTLDANGVTGRAWRGAAVGSAVALMTLVGLVFWWMRDATGSLLAPALVHAAANGGATVAAYVVLRSAASGHPPAEPVPDEASEHAEEQPS